MSFLTRGYSCVLGICVATALQLQYFSYRVGKARAKAKVPYPFSHVSKEECEKDRAKLVFACTHRAHLNTVESLPSFLLVCSVASLLHPFYASIAGVGYVAARAAYFHGYSSGSPQKRLRGAFAYISLLALLGLSLHTVYTAFITL